MADTAPTILRTMIVDDEPLAIDRLKAICGHIPALDIVATATDGGDALDKLDAMGSDRPDLLLLDLTMPEVDGLSVAKALAERKDPPAVIFVTAHDNHAVEAFDLDAVDYVLKPVEQDRLERAIARVQTRRSAEPRAQQSTEWLQELWVPHRSELVRVDVSEVGRIDAERDYVRLNLGSGANARSYLLLQTIAGLETRLDPQQFIRIHRSIILRRDRITGLRHDGLGVWSVETCDGEQLRIGRTYLPKIKAMAGR